MRQVDIVNHGGFMVVTETIDVDLLRDWERIGGVKIDRTIQITTPVRSGAKRKAKA